MSAERMMKLMTAARQSPHFGVRLLAELPAPARAEALRRWTAVAASPSQVEAPLPGLKKCGPGGAMKSFSSEQLASFARTIGRVG
jgi:hypothetical protein